MVRTLALLLVLTAVPLRGDFREFSDLPIDPSLQTRIRHAAEESLRQFPNLKPEDLAITIVDLTRSTIGRGDYHGDAPFYPASVIKLFFMTDTFMQSKQSVPDVDRALKEMIVVSDNDATAYLVDILADTSSGPNLEGRALRKFIDKRRSINRHFARLGYDISAMMKPWSFGPFGRELQLLGKNRENRNRLTSNATASIVLWIAQRRAPSSEAQLALLHRPLDPRDDENQVKHFIGEALPAGSKLWSKSGWTSEVRHDAAYFELPDGRKYVLVIFTRGQASDLTLLPGITRSILSELAPLKPEG